MRKADLQRLVDARKTNLTVEELIRNKRAEGGLGSDCESIARWLFRTRNVVVSTAFVASVIAKK